MTENSPKTSQRRAVLQAAGLAALAPAAAVLCPGQVRAQEKIAQSLVMYQATPNDGKRCDQCQHWQAPNACAIVAGTISPSGWCGVFAPKG